MNVPSNNQTEDSFALMYKIFNNHEPAIKRWGSLPNIAISVQTESNMESSMGIIHEHQLRRHDSDSVVNYGAEEDASQTFAEDFFEVPNDAIPFILRRLIRYDSNSEIQPASETNGIFGISCDNASRTPSSEAESTICYQSFEDGGSTDSSSWITISDASTCGSSITSSIFDYSNASNTTLTWINESDTEAELNFRNDTNAASRGRLYRRYLSDTNINYGEWALSDVESTNPFDNATEQEFDIMESHREQLNFTDMDTSESHSEYNTMSAASDNTSAHNFDDDESFYVRIQSMTHAERSAECLRLQRDIRRHLEYFDASLREIEARKNAIKMRIQHEFGDGERSHSLTDVEGFDNAIRSYRDVQRSTEDLDARLLAIEDRRHYSVNSLVMRYELLMRFDIFSESSGSSTDETEEIEETEEEQNLVVPVPFMQMARNRLCHEFIHLRNNPSPYYSVRITDNFYIWVAIITGPVDSSYEGGRFEVQLSFSDNYPFTQPIVQFLTKIYHCNVSEEGYVCNENEYRDEMWSPMMRVETILLSLYCLLADCEPQNAIQPDIAHQYLLFPKAHNELAREYTARFAMNKNESDVKEIEAPELRAIKDVAEKNTEEVVKSEQSEPDGNHAEEELAPTTDYDGLCLFRIPSPLVGKGEAVYEVYNLDENALREDETRQIDCNDDELDEADEGETRDNEANDNAFNELAEYTMEENEARKIEDDGEQDKSAVDAMEDNEAEANDDDGEVDKPDEDAMEDYEAGENEFNNDPQENGLGEDKAREDEDDLDESVVDAMEGDEEPNGASDKGALANVYEVDVQN